MQTALFIRQHPPAGLAGRLARRLTSSKTKKEDEAEVAESKAETEQEPEPEPEQEPEASTPTPQEDADTTDKDAPSDTPSDAPSLPPRVTFADLPAEIRSAIWTEALPRRVIGLRPLVPDAYDRAATTNLFEYDNYNYDHIPYGQVVPPSPRSGSGSRMPQVLASTCYESRQATLRRGRWTIGAEGQPVWYDPSRDTILLNSKRPVDYMLLGRATRPDGTRTPPRLASPVGGSSRQDDDEVSIWRVPVAGPPPPMAPVLPDRLPNTPPPVNPANTVSIADLAQHQLIGCVDEAIRSGGYIAVEHALLSSHIGRQIFPLLQRCALVAEERRDKNQQNGGRRQKQKQLAQLLVYFDEIVLSGTREQAVASGLFGTAASPEEQMFFVPLSDRQTLQRIHDMHRVKPLEADDSSDSDGVDDLGSQGRAQLRGKIGGLRMGNAGFLKELMRPSHTVGNLRILSIRFLTHIGKWRAAQMSNSTEELIARAMEEGLPPLEQAILFRFKEDEPKEEAKPASEASS